MSLTFILKSIITEQEVRKGIGREMTMGIERGNGERREHVNEMKKREMAKRNNYINTQ